MPDAVVGSVVIPMDLRGDDKTPVKIPADVANYFGVVPPTSTGAEMRVRKRTAHTRMVYNGIDDATGTASTVKASTWEAPDRLSEGVSGTPVRIPSERKNANGTLRYVTVRFPAKATVGDISHFIFTKFVTHKPTSFIHNGNTYAVLRKKDIGTAPDPTPSS